MRVFVGIQLSEYTKRKIRTWQREYQSAYCSKGIRWIKRKNLHITVIPPWEEKEIDSLIQTLRQQEISVLSFEILFTQIIFFPSKKPLYVCAEGKVPPEMFHLRDDIAKALNQQVEKRPFKLHATIGRIKKGTRVHPFIETISWSMKVKSFTLFSSHLSQKGAEYKVLAVFPLS